MIFEFRVVGLFLLFFLLCSYFYQYRGKKRNFSFVLVSTYLLEFFYLLCFIFDSRFGDVIILHRVYYLFVLLTLVSHTYYLYTFGLENQYVYDSVSFLKHKKIVQVISLVFCFAFLLFCCLFQEKIVTSLLIWIYFFHILMDLVIIFIKRKYFHREDYRYLLLLFGIKSLFFILDYHFYRLNFLETALVLQVVYLYVFLENGFKREVDSLTLERDYYAHNVMDKEAFLKKLSYEIRGPIHTIDGFSQLMLDVQDIDEMREDAKDMRYASLELIQLINSMIDLSVLETGELRIIPEAYHVYDVFDDLVEMIPSRIKSENVQFDYQIDKGVPELLLGDSERICQAILSILSNIIKYTDKGKISLHVSSVKSDSICRLIVRIKDTGKGIGSEDIRYLLSNDSQEKGIGFKVAYRLIELMNGKFDINSLVGVGAEVVISVDQGIVSGDEMVKARKKKEISFVSFNDRRVMVVDDNKLNLKVASKLLEAYDISVVCVSSGQECLDVLDKDTNFDLILMDDMMPKMSGTQTLDVLRKIERVDGYYIPVVVLTANASYGMKDKYLESGFDSYLAKPIDRVELDYVLKKYLKK